MAIEQDLPLVSTIAVGISLAFICGMAASKLRISPIVGYLLAGIVVSPHTPGYVADINLAHELSEIGIVLLMFGVGLHFSISDLMSVRKIAVTGAILRIIVTTAIGAGIASLWGWDLKGGILFGLALSVASTVVLIRSLESLNLQNSIEGRIAIGWLIVEDIIMILALVLIPALAIEVDNPTLGAYTKPVFIAVLKAGAFIAIMEVAGRKFLPLLLTSVARTGSRELFTLAVIAAAIGISFGAAHLFGVSLALGAFFAGVVIKESDLNNEVANRALPFQDAFAVLFFVAVGMLFDPMILIENPLGVVITTAVIIIVKFAITYAIVALFKYPLKKRLTIAAGLAQIGEFSFILISLGLIYGLLPEEGQDLLLAGAMASIALNPMLFYGVRKILAAQPTRLSDQFSQEDDLAHLSGGEKHVLRDLVILVGYGRLGRHVLQHIHEAHIDMVLVELNREKVEALRKEGIHAIAGDAGHPETLEEAAIKKAKAIVVAVTDPYQARRIVETARDLKPSIKVLVRAMSSEELEYFQEKDVDLAILGVQEIGRKMVTYLNELQPGPGELSGDAPPLGGAKAKKAIS